jgi:hypothetical protein
VSVRGALPQISEKKLAKVAEAKVEWEGSGGPVPLAEFRRRYPGSGQAGAVVHRLSPAGGGPGLHIALTRAELHEAVAEAVARYAAELDERHDSAQPADGE